MGILGLFMVVPIVLFALTWRLTKNWPLALRLLPTTLVAALTIAPGVVFGHGVAIVPAIFVLIGGDDRIGASKSVLYIWAVFYAGSLVVVWLLRLFKRKRKLFWLLTAVALAGILAMTALGRLRIRHRVVTVDLKGIYPTIGSYNGVSPVVTVGDYPATSVPTPYYFKSNQGTIALTLSLEDQTKLFNGTRHPAGEQTWLPIGDECYFQDSGQGLELVYRRQNIQASFSSSPVLRSGVGKEELKDAAKALDAAVSTGSPNVIGQDVHLSQIITHKLKEWAFPFFWMFYLYD
jgi:hypothetical protein